MLYIETFCTYKDINDSFWYEKQYLTCSTTYRKKCHNFEISNRFLFCDKVRRKQFFSPAISWRNQLATLFIGKIKPAEHFAQKKDGIWIIHNLMLLILLLFLLLLQKVFCLPLCPCVCRNCVTWVEMIFRKWNHTFDNFSKQLYDLFPASPQPKFQRNNRTFCSGIFYRYNFAVFVTFWIFFQCLFERIITKKEMSLIDTMF